MPKPEKNTYLEYVKLSEEEYSKLTGKLGQAVTLDLIEDLNNYLGSTGKFRKYTSHYFTILAWSRRNRKKIRLFPIPGRTCSDSGCKMPAVYKNTKGAYDIFKCSGHMPEEVKKKYY